MSRFMETQITVKQKWLCITETYAPHETWYVPASECPTFPKDNVTIEEVIGYGVRESAPGYLDCTDWEVFTDLADAEAAACQIDESYEEDEA